MSDSTEQVNPKPETRYSVRPSGQRYAGEWVVEDEITEQAIVYCRSEAEAEKLRSEMEQEAPNLTLGTGLRGRNLQPAVDEAEPEAQP